MPAALPEAIPAATPEPGLAARDIRALVDRLQTQQQPRLQQRLQTLLPGLHVEVLGSVDSTNTRLLERARATPSGQRCAPRLLVALEQTGGRGRLGRAWHSAPGASLTMSLALPLAPASWSGLSLAVGLALADALDPPAPGDAAARIGLKWPNDLWLWDGPGRGRKLCGILIETVVVGTQRVCVAGVGLNVAPQRDSAISAISAISGTTGTGATGSRSACLQELQPGIGVDDALDRAAVALLQALLQFEHAGFAPLAAAYARRDLLRGQPVRTQQAHSTAGAERTGLTGVAAGVDANGALCVQAGSTLHRVLSGEVSVRLQQAPTPQSPETSNTSDTSDAPDAPAAPDAPDPAAVRSGAVPC